MNEYMVELYVSRMDAGAVSRTARRARLTADRLTTEGTPVRYLRSMHVKEDETCFFLFEAESADAVVAVARGALLGVVHVAEVVEEPQR